jgi:hypothetical protein
MRIIRCRHKWGFPRRWSEFLGHRNVDVQTCVRCGDRRISPVQFGAAPPEALLEQQKVFKWIRINS